MTLKFRCTIGADLGKEEVLYDGRSLGKTLEIARLAAKVVRLFDLTAVIKVTRYREVGGREPVLGRWLYEDGLLSKEEQFYPMNTWLNKELLPTEGKS